MNNLDTQITKKTIKGHEYEIRPLDAMYNLNLAARFLAIVGTSFHSIFSVQDGKGFGEIGTGIHQLAQAISEKDPKGDMILEIMSQTTRDGKAINRVTFNEFYTGNMKELMVALAACIEVNFLRFLDEEIASGFLARVARLTAGNSGS